MFHRGVAQSSDQQPSPIARSKVMFPGPRGEVGWVSHPVYINQNSPMSHHSRSLTLAGKESPQPPVSHPVGGPIVLAGVSRVLYIHNDPSNQGCFHLRDSKTARNTTSIWTCSSGVRGIVLGADWGSSSGSGGISMPSCYELLCPLFSGKHFVILV